VTGEPRTAPVAEAPRRLGLLVSVAAALIGILLAALLWFSKPSGPRPPVPAERPDGPTSAAPATTTAAAPHRPASSPGIPGPPVQAVTPRHTSGPRAVRVAVARGVKGVLPVEEGDTFCRDDR
jgi:hypothetical protein